MNPKAELSDGVVEEHCREPGKRGFGVYRNGVCVWYSEWLADEVTPDKIVMLEQFFESRKPARRLHIMRAQTGETG